MNEQFTCTYQAGTGKKKKTTHHFVGDGEYFLEVTRPLTKKELVEWRMPEGEIKMHKRWFAWNSPSTPFKKVKPGD